LKRSQGLVENPRPTLRFSTSLVMSFTTVLDFCSEDGGVKGGGRGVEGGLAGRVVLAVGLVLAGGVVLEKVVVSGFRARCVLIAASWCADWNSERASS